MHMSGKHLHVYALRKYINCSTWPRDGLVEIYFGIAVLAHVATAHTLLDICCHSETVFVIYKHNLCFSKLT